VRKLIFSVFSLLLFSSLAQAQAPHRQEIHGKAAFDLAASLSAITLDQSTEIAQGIAFWNDNLNHLPLPTDYNDLTNIILKVNKVDCVYSVDSHLMLCTFVLPDSPYFAFSRATPAFAFSESLKNLGMTENSDSAAGTYSISSGAITCTLNLMEYVNRDGAGANCLIQDSAGH
jgi:hypothetical protein